MTDETELAAIVSARICHDFGSPIGAVVNGVDLLQEVGADQNHGELEMLRRSARRATALLRFHRLAFGMARDPEATLARDELGGRADAVLGSARVTLDWSGVEGPPLSLPAGRLAALLLLAGRGVLGISGTLRVMLPAAGDLPLSVMAEGERATLSADRRRWLEGGPGPGPDAPEVEFALIPAAAAAIGARVEMVAGEGRVALRAVAA